MLVGTLASTLGYIGVISKPDATVLQPATDSLKVGLPILNMGLPKSGDTSLLDMFSCAGLKASHYHCKRPSIDAKPYPTAVEVSAKCRNEKACRCKVFGNCTGTGLTTEPTDAYPLHNPFHYCKTYGMCDNEDLPKHLRPTGFENITYKDPYCGSCIMNNVLNEEVPLAGCGDFDVFAQLDGPWQEGKCFLPQIFSLNKLHEAYPDATLLLPTRPAAKWVKSHAMQRGSEMRQLLGACNLPTCGPACVDSDNLFAAFYTEHALAIRTFAKKYGHTLIEVDVEAEDAGEQLANATGLGSSCWGQQSCKASCNFWHDMSNQRAMEKEEADKQPNPAWSAEKAAEKRAAEKAAEKVEEAAEKAEKVVRPKVMTGGTPEGDDFPVAGATAPVVPGTPGFEAAPYVPPVVPGTPSFEAAPAAAPAADAPVAESPAESPATGAPAAEAPAYAPGPTVPAVPEIPISVSSPEAAEKARREDEAARNIEAKRDEVARRHAAQEAAKSPKVVAEKGPALPSDSAPTGLDDVAKNMAQAAEEAAAKATSEILAAGKKAEEEHKQQAKAAKIVADAEAVEREAAEAEPVQLPVAVTPLPLPAAASPLPLPVVPEGLPIVPQLEQPKAAPIPEIPSSVSAPFAAAEAAKAATAGGNVTPGSGSGDIGQTMADNAAAAAAEMVRATNEARDKLIDSLPTEPVADSSVVPGSTGDPFAEKDETAGTIPVGRVDKLGHVIDDNDVPNRVMTIGEKDTESEKLKARRTRQKRWQKAEGEKLRREAEKQETEKQEAEKLSRKRAKMKCLGQDGEPVYCSAKGARAQMKCLGQDGQPAYCSAKGAKPAPA